jgi:hypothetical protein
VLVVFLKIRDIINNSSVNKEQRLNELGALFLPRDYTSFNKACGALRFARYMIQFSMISKRATVGETGNTGIDSYGTQGLLQRTSYAFDESADYSFSPNQLRNDNLKWETTRQSFAYSWFDRKSSIF